MRRLILAAVVVVVAALAAGCTAPFEKSQDMQNLVMVQFRDEMIRYNANVLSQVRRDKAQVIDMAFRWDLADASKDGQVPVAFVLTKDKERKSKIAEAEGYIAGLDMDFGERVKLINRAIALGGATLDVLSQWTRTGKALEGVFSRTPEVFSAIDKATAPEPVAPAVPKTAIEAALEALSPAGDAPTAPVKPFPATASPPAASGP